MYLGYVYDDKYNYSRYYLTINAIRIAVIIDNVKLTIDNALGMFLFFFEKKYSSTDTNKYKATAGRANLSIVIFLSATKLIETKNII